MVSRKAHNLKTVVRFDLPQHSASDMPKTMSFAENVDVAQLVRAGVS
jgi:hypothetical protein